MLTFTITNREKPVVYTPAVYQQPVINSVVANTAAQNLFNEIKRREQVITELVKQFKYNAGDTIIPADEEDFKKYGTCTVMAICDQYIHLGKDFKWPKNDNPMIVTASSEAGELFFATTNYFKGK